LQEGGPRCHFLVFFFFFFFFFLWYWVVDLTLTFARQVLSLDALCQPRSSLLHGGRWTWVLPRFVVEVFQMMHGQNTMSTTKQS
jgi:hypothetical protein